MTLIYPDRGLANNHNLSQGKKTPTNARSLTHPYPIQTPARPTQYLMPQQPHIHMPGKTEYNSSTKPIQLCWPASRNQEPTVVPKGCSQIQRRGGIIPTIRQTAGSVRRRQSLKRPRHTVANVGARRLVRMGLVAVLVGMLDWGCRWWWLSMVDGDGQRRGFDDAVARMGSHGAGAGAGG